MAVKQQASNTAFCCRRASKKPGASRGSASIKAVMRLGWCSLALLLLADCTGAAARPLTAAGSQSRRTAAYGGKLTGLQEGGH
jgi:hypothetical protein